MREEEKPEMFWQNILEWVDRKDWGPTVEAYSPGIPDGVPMVKGCIDNFEYSEL